MTAVLNFLQDIRRAIVIGAISGAFAWRDLRWLRKGGCPDDLPF